uniref:Uncharacterized protein n=1 Tax=Oncorhynchus tshawytscha TaxID=74940 RepID=A0A8C8CSP9_ONCTS
MATRVLQRFGNGLSQAKNTAQSTGQTVVLSRGLSASNHRSREDSWFKSLFVRKVDPRKDAHSHLLTKNEESNLYKIQCKLMCLLLFSLDSEETLPSIHNDKYYPCELVGTWNTWYGEQDQAGKNAGSRVHTPPLSSLVELHILWNWHTCRDMQP